MGLGRISMMRMTVCRMGAGHVVERSGGAVVESDSIQG